MWFGIYGYFGVVAIGLSLLILAWFCWMMRKR